MEARADAWAQERLSPEEFADAVELDRQLKSHFWRWLALYAGSAALFTLLLMGIKPGLGWIETFGLVNLALASSLACIAAAWYGFRKYDGPSRWHRPAWIVVITSLGGIVGGLAAGLSSSQSFESLSVEELLRLLSIGSLTGIGLAAILMGVAHLRGREARQREARLAAEAEHERLTRQTVQAELKLLQAQVEPHFLFNTLANLRYLVQSRSDDALPMLDHLIHYLRTALPEIRSEGSTIGREVELARAYLEIMRLRMGGALAFTIDVPADAASYAFPSLMLMTLVENAMKHGVAPAGAGLIAITVKRAGERLTVLVEDDGRGLAGPLGHGVGLANVRERLAAIYGNGARLVLEGREAGGTRAMIEVTAK
jgi:sensor histidine kinase YesM